MIIIKIDFIAIGMSYKDYDTSKYSKGNYIIKLGSFEILVSDKNVSLKYNFK
jgi:hypothetical protein